MTFQNAERDLVNRKDPFSPTEDLVLQPFTPAEKKVLRKDGHLFYPLSLQTIGTQKEARRPLRITANEGPKFLNTTSMVGEVAFNPDPKRFFISGSNNQTYVQQEELIRAYERDLQKRLKLPEHVRVVMGQAPDYTQLAFIHLEETGDELFGLKYGFNLARTKTPISTSDVANVGRFYSVGLAVDALPRVMINNHVFLAPLVVSVVPIS